MKLVGTMEDRLFLHLIQITKAVHGRCQPAVWMEKTQDLSLHSKQKVG